MNTTKTKELNTRTGAGYEDCNFALWFARGDLDKAEQFLRSTHFNSRDKAYRSRIDELETALGILKEQVRVLVEGK